MRYMMTRRLFPILLTALLLSLSPAIAETYTDSTTGMEFVFFKGGKFLMGDIYGSDSLAKPPHAVTVDDFYIATREVTFAQYDQFCAETKRPKPDDKGWGRGNQPAINVSWHDAVAFTEWLSKKSKKSFRLPSEAEWEYAARGGGKIQQDYPWGSKVGVNLANCKGCGSQWDNQMTAPTGSFKSHFGLFDMVGNVYEWCLDTKHSNYQGAPSDGSPWIDPDQEDRIYRGGSWYQPPYDARIVSRSWDAADKRRSELGFRVVLEP